MGIANAIGDVRFMNEFFLAADRIAAELGEELPGVEHFVLAALGHSDDSARRALAGCGGDAVALRAALNDVHSAALGSLGLANLPAATEGSVHRIHRSTGAAQELYARAVELSKDSRPAKLRSAHLLLAAAERQLGTFAQALAAMGIDRQDLVAAARSSTQ